MLAVKFLLEVASLVAFAYAGGQAEPAAAAVALAVGLPSAAALVWGRWAAPRSAHRLADGPRTALELTVFGGAALALLLAGAPVLALVLGAAALVTTWALRA